MYDVISPIAFRLGPIQLYWYGIILSVAALIGLIVVIQEGKRYQIAPGFFLDMVLVGVPSAIVGARAYYVIFKWEDYRDNFWDVFKIWNGGIAIYGALIGAIIAMIFFFRMRGYNFWRIADLCAPGLIIGQLIGRWGNFINQEAHGGPVSEDFLRTTLHLPNFIVNQMNIEGVYYHPTFLYESIWNFVGLLLLLWLRRQPFLRSGELFLIYFTWYSIGRFFIEGLRTDSLAWYASNWLAALMKLLWSPMGLLFQEGDMSYGTVRVSQLLSVLIILIAICLMAHRRFRKHQERYADPIASNRS
ncbi:prolipoprotein diacylglyceryl transferase [Paenibacillus lautus]|uniref:prolipoprotein diacylglyceryl transferase n=1 Tax=Paenibacillus sp. FSL W8-1287 TaxID=2954653 RepID=UPI002FBD90FB